MDMTIVMTTGEAVDIEASQVDIVDPEVTAVDRDGNVQRFDLDNIAEMYIREG